MDSRIRILLRQRQHFFQTHFVPLQQTKQRRESHIGAVVAQQLLAKGNIAQVTERPPPGVENQTVFLLGQPVDQGRAQVCLFCLPNCLNGLKPNARLGIHQGHHDPFWQSTLGAVIPDPMSQDAQGLDA